MKNDIQSFETSKMSTKRNVFYPRSTGKNESNTRIITPKNSDRNRIDKNTIIRSANLRNKSNLTNLSNNNHGNLKKKICRIQLQKQISRVK